MGAPFGKVAAAPFGKVAAPFGKFGAFPFAAGFGKAAVVAAPVDKKVPFGKFGPADYGKFDTFPVGKVAPVGKVVAVEKALVAAPVATKKVVAPAGAFNVFPNGPFVGGKAAGVVVPGKKLASAGFAGFF